MKDILVFRFVFDRKNSISKKIKETALLQIEVRQLKTANRIYISTGIRLKGDQFSDKNGFTCRNHTNATAVTAKAHSIYRKVEAFGSSENCKILENIKNWNKDEAVTTSVVGFIRSELRRRNPSESVLNQNNSFINHFENFGKIKVFNDLSYESVLGFDEYLRQFIKSTPTLYKRHSLLRGISEKLLKGAFATPTPMT